MKVKKKEKKKKRFSHNDTRTTTNIKSMNASFSTLWLSFCTFSSVVWLNVSYCSEASGKSGEIYIHPVQGQTQITALALFMLAAVYMGR